MKLQIELNWPKASVTSFCEYGNEFQGSLNSGEFLAWLSDYFSRKALYYEVNYRALLGALDLGYTRSHDAGRIWQQSILKHHSTRQRTSRQSDNTELEMSDKRRRSASL
jgi:hypothetical protein